MRLLSLLPSVLVFLVVLLGCASPSYRAPMLAADEMAQQQKQLQLAAIDFQRKRRARLYDLAWPLLVKNTVLCPKTRNSAGLVLADRAAYADFIGGLKAEQLANLGFADEAHILHVMKNSPADKAGLRAGMLVRGVNGIDFTGQKPSRLLKAISKAVKKGDQLLSLGVVAEGDMQEITLRPVKVCDVAVKLNKSGALNAYALDKSITFFAGLMRAADDDAVQAVLAHELAHVALRHPAKYKRNAVVSGAVLYGPVLYLSGNFADTALRMAGIKRKGSLASRALSVSAPYTDGFEAEADYVGLYMLARAGGNVEKGGEVFRLFARESPGSTWLHYTHPLTPERVLAARLTAEEISRKRATNKTLLPEVK